MSGRVPRHCGKSARVQSRLSLISAFINKLRPSFPLDTVLTLNHYKASSRTLGHFLCPTADTDIIHQAVRRAHQGSLQNIAAFGNTDSQGNHGHQGKLSSHCRSFLTGEFLHDKETVSGISLSRHERVLKPPGYLKIPSDLIPGAFLFFDLAGRRAGGQGHAKVVGDV